MLRCLAGWFIPTIEGTTDYVYVGWLVRGREAKRRIVVELPEEFSMLKRMMGVDQTCVLFR